MSMKRRPKKRASRSNSHRFIKKHSFLLVFQASGALGDAQNRCFFRGRLRGRFGAVLGSFWGCFWGRFEAAFEVVLV